MAKKNVANNNKSNVDIVKEIMSFVHQKKLIDRFM